MWHDDYYDDDGDYLVPWGDDDDKFFKWYSYYYSYCYSYYYCQYHYYYYQFINNKNREAQKAQIKEELIYLASIKVVGLVCIRGLEKTGRNAVDVTMFMRPAKDIRQLFLTIWYIFETINHRSRVYFYITWFKDINKDDH